MIKMFTKSSPKLPDPIEGPLIEPKKFYAEKKPEAR